MIACVLLAACLISACTSAAGMAGKDATVLKQSSTAGVNSLGTSVLLTQAVTLTSSLQSTQAPLSTVTQINTPSASATYDPASWQSLPIIPTWTETARRVYALGQTYHNDAHAFSKVGDCETSSPYFLTDYDSGKTTYNLGTYTNLQTVIGYFSGSFGRKSLAAGQGYKASTVLNSLYADTGQCTANETPLACEYRLHKPSFVFIMFGTNDYINSRPVFETYMKQIIEQSMSLGIVPILTTKADDLEGDNSINTLIAQLAHDYDIPLWNFYAAVHPLPNHGLKEDGIHLTFYKNDFSDSTAFQYAFPVRNLDALEVLYSLWEGLQKN